MIVTLMQCWLKLVVFLVMFILTTLLLQRKLERDFVIFGGAPPDSGADAAVADEEHEHEPDEDTELVPSVSGIISNLYQPTYS